MKRLNIKTAIAVGATALAACSTQDLSDNFNTDTDSDRKNEYTQKWIDRFGLFDTEHDWTTLTSVRTEVSGEFGADAMTHIYNADPQTGGHLIGFTREAGSLMLALPKGAQSVYAVVSDANGRTLASGEFDVAQGRVTISAAQAHEPAQSRAAHTPSYFDAMVVCEDLGGIGDYDFNDIVLGLRYVSGTNTLKVMPMAAGGTLEADVYYDGVKKGEIHDMIEPGSSASSMLNTNSFSKIGTMQNITVPTGFSLTDGWKKISLKVKDADATVEIAAPDKKGEAPQMFCLGGDWYWPTEKTPIDDAYTGFASWTADASADTWADAYSDASKVVKWDVSQVATNWFSGTTSDGNPYRVKINNATYANVNSGQIYTLDPPASFASMFNGASTLTSLDVAADHFDTSLANDMSYAFNGCSGLTSLDISNWDTGNVTTMSWMFNGCSSVTDLNLSGLNTSKVTDMNGLLRDCTLLRNLDISGWDISNVKATNWFFDGCSNLESVTLNNWINSSEKSNIRTIIGDLPASVKTLTMQNCDFTGTKDLRTMSGNMYYGIFDNLESLTTLDVTGWKIPDLTTLQSALSGCSDLEAIAGIETWRTPGVTSLSSTFWGCTKLKSLDLSGWDTSNVTSMFGMFNSCESLNDLNLSGMKTANVTNMDVMFAGCSSLTNLDISGWDISKVSSATRFIDDCDKLESLTMNNWVNSSASTRLREMLHNLPASVKTLVMRDCDFTGTKDLSWTPYDSYKIFEDLKSLTTLDVTGWKIPDLTTLQSAFSGCSGLETIIGIGTWAIPSVTNLSGIFSGCSKLKNLDISGWDISKVTDLSYMFSNCPTDIHITCSQATKDKLVANKESAKLPDNVQWTIVP